MTTLSVRAQTSTVPKSISGMDFEMAVFRACEEWNHALDGVVKFERAGRLEIPDVEVRFGDTITNRERWAEHRLTRGRSVIELDIRRSWRVRAQWWRFFADRIEPAILHELGHALRLPHSDNPTLIMHPDWPDVDKISGPEAASYRETLKQLTA